MQIWKRDRRRRTEVSTREVASDVASEPPRPSEVLDRLHEAIIVVGPERRVRWLNSAAQEIFDAPQTAPDRSLLEVVRDHRLEALVGRAVEGGAEQSAEVDQRGTERVLKARAVPLMGMPAVALILEDITGLRHLETVRQQFVANLSHELRTPLAGLDLAAQTLSSQLNLVGDSRVFLDRILQESRQLAAILQNLSQLAALDSEQIRTVRLPFALGPLLRENVDRFAERAAKLGLALRAELLEESLVVLGDRAKTDQALQSLIDNALKFTTQGEVVLTAKPAGQTAEVTVQDTGVGIPPQDLPHIFERFYKVDRARGGGVPGSGLGLSIARHLVELQGGTISAESSPGAGTSVRIWLPLSRLTPS